MLSSKLDGKIIFSDKYIGFNDEIAIKKIAELKQFQREGRLTCCDENCNAPLVFCHGPEKGSYFRHEKGYGEQCEYNRYSAKRESFHKLKTLLYKQLTDLGLEVSVDTKLIPHHWTDIVITFPDGKRVAVELTDRHPGGMDWIKYHNQYRKLGIPDIWMIRGEVPSSEAYRDMYVTDMMQYMDDAQGYAIYFNEETERFTVRTPINFDAKYSDLLERKFIIVELSCKEIMLGDDGKLAGKYIEQYELERNRIVSNYLIAEKQREEKMQNERLQRQEDERKEIFVKLKSREQHRIHTEVKIGRTQKVVSKTRKSDEAKRKNDVNQKYFNENIKVIFRNNGIVFDVEKFKRFLNDNDNWLSNAYVMGRDDQIMIAKYKNS